MPRPQLTDTSALSLVRGPGVFGAQHDTSSDSTAADELGKLAGRLQQDLKRCHQAITTLHGASADTSPIVALKMASREVSAELSAASSLRGQQAPAGADEEPHSPSM